MVTQRKLLKRLDQERVEEAIRAAQSGTTGEIRVSVAPLFWGDVEHGAKKAFHRLGLHTIPDRNAVLFFVVPSRRKCVVWGDAGIHEKAGDQFWQETLRTVAAHFRDGNFTDGLVTGVALVGEQLSVHFPSRA